MFSPKNKSRNDFFDKLHKLDGVYGWVFFKLNKNGSLTNDIKESIESIKEVDIILYHITWAFVYEHLGREYYTNAISNYTDALNYYMGDFQHRLAFNTLKIKYQSIKAELSASYKKQLYDISLRINRPDLYDGAPSLVDILSEIKKLKESVDSLEDPYKEKCLELLSGIDAIPPDKITDILSYSSAQTILAGIYDLFLIENYAEQQWLLNKFSGISLDGPKDENPELKFKKETTQKCHWLIDSILTEKNIYQFINNISNSLLTTKDNKRTSTDDDTQTPNIFNDAGLSKRKIVIPKKGHLNKLFSSIDENKNDFIAQLYSLDQVYRSIFLALDKDPRLTSEITNKINEIKKINMILYNFTLAFVYQQLGDPQKAGDSCSIALSEYYDNKQEFTAFQTKYSAYLNRQSKICKFQLYEFSSRVHQDEISLKDMLNKISELNRNAAFLEKKYYTQITQLSNEINAIKSDFALEPFNLSLYVNIKKVILLIYQELLNEQYGINELPLLTQFKTTLDGVVYINCHSLIHNLLVANNITEYIKQQLCVVNPSNPKKRNDSNASIESDDHIEKFKRRIVLANTNHITQDSIEETHGKESEDEYIDDDSQSSSRKSESDISSSSDDENTNYIYRFSRYNVMGGT